MLTTTNYLSFFLIIIVSFIFSFILIFLAYLLAPKNPTNEKMSAYECGFEPFSDTRRGFDVHFYVVAILFIIFDLEVAYLLPWAVAVDYTNYSGFITVFIFILILTIGFIYEYACGALNWQDRRIST